MKNMKNVSRFEQKMNSIDNRCKYDHKNVKQYFNTWK